MPKKTKTTNKTKFERGTKKVTALVAPKRAVIKKTAVSVEFAKTIRVAKKNISALIARVKNNRRALMIVSGVMLVILGLIIRGIVAPSPVSKKAAPDVVKPANTVVQRKTAKVAQPAAKTVNYSKAQGVGFVNKANGVRVSEIALKRSKAQPADGLRIVCADFGCVNQYVYNKDDKLVAAPAAKLVAKKVHKGDFELSPRNINLPADTKITGNLYISGMDFVRISRGVEVLGNVYISDAKMVRFDGFNRVDGSVLTKGAASIIAPKDKVSIKGQIVIAKK